MNGNEYLALDYANLAKRIKKAEEDIRLVESERDRVRRELQHEVSIVAQEPNRILSELNADISVKSKEVKTLDAEIEVKKEISRKIEESGRKTQQVASEVVRKHQENASNAILRRKVAEEALEKAKRERGAHDARISVAIDEKKKIENEIGVVENLLTTLKYSVSAHQDEKKVLEEEIEEIRKFLERYRGDRLNLEEWERRLTGKEKYLVELAKKLEKYVIPYH